MEVHFNVKKWGGEYVPQFTIGVQTFSLLAQETEEQAEWYIKMLKVAFKNLKEGGNHETK